jgi:Transposase DDE domain group 1
MVISANERSAKKAAKQGAGKDAPEPIRINGFTPFDFDSKQLTAYGGLLPVATMLEKLKFQQLVEETLTVKRVTRAMPMYQFVLGMVLALYVGFSRLNHLRFLAREPMLIGILKVLQLPPQCTFWRFLASLHGSVAQQLLEVQRQMRQRVWEGAHVKLTAVTLDTDTTVHTVFGKQMGARKGYNPRNKGKKSYQPILTFLAETREYVGGELHNGDRPTGIQIARHLESVLLTLPKGVKTIYARADSGFYCWEAVQAYQKHGCQFIVVARKTPRLVEELKSAHWKRSPRTDADEQCEFWYQPQGWEHAFRFIALRYEKKPEPKKKEEPEQYQLFETLEYTYRVFVTNMDGPIDLLVWFYNQRATAENLIQEANNDAGLAAHPSKRWAMNCNHFQMAMLAYNLNCWLSLFNREEKTDTAKMKHTRLSTARLRFLFLAAKIWRHAGRVGVSYSDHYEEKGIFQRLMERLRAITDDGSRFAPVVLSALRC